MAEAKFTEGSFNISESGRDSVIVMKAYGWITLVDCINNETTEMQQRCYPEEATYNLY